MQAFNKNPRRLFPMFLSNCPKFGNLLNLLKAVSVLAVDVFWLMLKLLGLLREHVATPTVRANCIPTDATDGVHAIDHQSTTQPVHPARPFSPLPDDDPCCHHNQPTQPAQLIASLSTILTAVLQFKCTGKQTVLMPTGSAARAIVGWPDYGEFDTHILLFINLRHLWESCRKWREDYHHEDPFPAMPPFPAEFFWRIITISFYPVGIILMHPSGLPHDPEGGFLDHVPAINDVLQLNLDFESSAFKGARVNLVEKLKKSRYYLMGTFTRASPSLSLEEQIAQKREYYREMIGDVHDPMRALVDFGGVHSVFCTRSDEVNPQQFRLKKGSADTLLKLVSSGFQAPILQAMRDPELRSVGQQPASSAAPTPRRDGTLFPFLLKIEMPQQLQWERDGDLMAYVVFNATQAGGSMMTIDGLGGVRRLATIEEGDHMLVTFEALPEGGNQAGLTPVLKLKFYKQGDAGIPSTVPLKDWLSLSLYESYKQAQQARDSFESESFATLEELNEDASGVLRKMLVVAEHFDAMGGKLLEAANGCKRFGDAFKEMRLARRNRAGASENGVRVNVQEADDSYYSPYRVVTSTSTAEELVVEFDKAAAAATAAKNAMQNVASEDISLVTALSEPAPKDAGDLQKALVRKLAVREGDSCNTLYSPIQGISNSLSVVDDELGILQYKARILFKGDARIDKNLPADAEHDEHILVLEQYAVNVGMADFSEAIKVYAQKTRQPLNWWDAKGDLIAPSKRKPLTKQPASVVKPIIDVFLKENTHYLVNLALDPAVLKVFQVPFPDQISGREFQAAGQDKGRATKDAKASFEYNNHEWAVIPFDVLVEYLDQDTREPEPKFDTDLMGYLESDNMSKSDAIAKCFATMVAAVKPRGANEALIAGYPDPIKKKYLKWTFDNEEGKTRKQILVKNKNIMRNATIQMRTFYDTLTEVTKSNIQAMEPAVRNEELRARYIEWVNDQSGAQQQVPQEVVGLLAAQAAHAPAQASLDSTTPSPPPSAAGVDSEDEDLREAIALSLQQPFEAVDTTAAIFDTIDDGAGPSKVVRKSQQQPEANFRPVHVQQQQQQQQQVEMEGVSDGGIVLMGECAQQAAMQRKRAAGIVADGEGMQLAASHSIQCLRRSKKSRRAGGVDCDDTVVDVTGEVEDLDGLVRVQQQQQVQLNPAISSLVPVQAAATEEEKEDGEEEVIDLTMDSDD